MARQSSHESAMMLMKIAQQHSCRSCEECRLLRKHSQQQQCCAGRKEVGKNN